jgi:hypothetical protein
VLVLAVLAGGYAHSRDGDPNEARTMAREQEMAGPAEPDLPNCAAPDGTPRLESYWDLRLPATYWVDMVFRSDAWQPAEPIPMPHHHATRLELTNLGAFPSLSLHQANRLRFTVKVMSREIHQVRGRHEWRATYFAEIVGVCLP